MIFILYSPKGFNLYSLKLCKTGFSSLFFLLKLFFIKNRKLLKISSLNIVWVIVDLESDILVGTSNLSFCILVKKIK